MNDEQKHALAQFIRTAPEQICLNVSDDIKDIDANTQFSNCDFNGDITWSDGAAVEVAVPYIRADLVAELVEAFKKCIERVDSDNPPDIRDLVRYDALLKKYEATK
jgi:hypothetical protein